MPYVYQTFKKDGTPHRRWRFQYRDWEGKKKKGTGFPSKTDTKKLANEIQAEQDAIRRGDRPRPKLSDEPWSFEEVAESYLSWGETQGGRAGRPWSKRHRRMKKVHLAWWREKLGVTKLSQLDGCLASVEKALQGSLRG